jgi:hypothetical protein
MLKLCLSKNRESKNRQFGKGAKNKSAEPLVAKSMLLGLTTLS